MTLYIGYPDIPNAAISRSTANTWATDYDYGNLIYGERYLYAKPSAAADLDVTFDLGIGYSSAVTYIILARADKLQSAGVTSVLLKSGDGVTSPSTALTISSFNSATLYGPRSHDYIQTGLSLTAARVWELVTSGGSGLRILSKAYFGTAFNMGVDPIFAPSYNLPDQAEFATESGARNFYRMADPKWTFSYTWEGVSDTKVGDFFSTIVKNKDRQRFFLFTDSNHHVLANLRVLHVRLLEAETTNPDQKINQNTVTATFEEILG